jgi:hypothetical protein
MVAVSGSNDFNADTRAGARPNAREAARAPFELKLQRSSRAREETAERHAIARDSDVAIALGPDAVRCAAASAPDIARRLMMSCYSGTPTCA